MTLRVNGEPIPEEAILTELHRLMEFHAQHVSREDLGHHMPELVRQAKEQAVGAKLLLDEAARQKLEVTEAEVDESLERMVTQAGGEAKFDALLERNHLTRQGLRFSIRNGKRIDKLVARVTAKVPPPSDADVRAYYDRHPERYVSADRAAFRHILVRPAGDGAAEKTAAREQMLQWRNEILEGRDFAEVAAERSECPSGRETGGSLGWLERGRAIPAFEEAAFPLEIGEISDVVETPLGLHLIQKAGEEKGQPLPFDEVRDRVRDLLVHHLRGQALSAYVRKLRAEVVVEDDEDDTLTSPPPDDGEEDPEGESDADAPT
jgi:peptidyl-prolyl cis-trans isomerase C